MWESFFFILMLNGNLIVKDTPQPFVVDPLVAQHCAEHAKIEDYRDRLEYEDGEKALTMLDCIYSQTGAY